MYPSYELLCHVPTQSLFNTKISMMQKFSTFSVLSGSVGCPLQAKVGLSCPKWVCSLLSGSVLS